VLTQKTFTSRTKKTNNNTEINNDALRRKQRYKRVKQTGVSSAEMLMNPNFPLCLFRVDGISTTMTHFALAGYFIVLEQTQSVTSIGIP